MPYTIFGKGVSGIEAHAVDLQLEPVPLQLKPLAFQVRSTAHPAILCPCHVESSTVLPESSPKYAGPRLLF